MPGDKNPWEIPEWHSIGREASLARHLIGSGATSLGKANYADQQGEYYTAFFSLSVGLERLAKLILVADYAITNNGEMPDEQGIRKYGHKLIQLLNIVDGISSKQNLNLKYHRPSSPVCEKIIECLDAFADARRGRYANFGSLDDPNLGQEEPIRKWWDIVAQEILNAHYFGKSVQKRVEAQASIADTLMSPISVVRFVNESGDIMQDVRSASIRTGQNELVQRYGRYYALSIARWLADVFSCLSHSACYDHSIDAFFGADEYLATFRVDDNFLRTRKVWPLK